MVIWTVLILALLAVFIRDRREYRRTGEAHAFAPVLFSGVLVFGVWAWAASGPFNGMTVIAGREGFEAHGRSFGGSLMGLFIVAAVMIVILVWRWLAVARQQRDYAAGLRKTPPPEPSPGGARGASPDRVKNSGLVD